MGMGSNLDKGHVDMTEAKGQTSLCGGVLQFPSVSLWNGHHPVDKCENTLSDDVTECLGGVSCVCAEWSRTRTGDESHVEGVYWVKRLKRVLYILWRRKRETLIETTTSNYYRHHSSGQTQEPHARTHSRNVWMDGVSI